MRTENEPTAETAVGQESKAASTYQEIFPDGRVVVRVLSVVVPSSPGSSSSIDAQTLYDFALRIGDHRR